MMRKRFPLWLIALAVGAQIFAGAVSGWADETAPTPHQQQLERERKLPADPAALEALAKSGNPDAQNRLALLYINGKGAPKDLAEGVKWLRKAARRIIPSPN